MMKLLIIVVLLVISFP
ncbi:TPA: type I toxin-antitoxin system Ibs family toxin, partial [Escherichia coli]